MKSDITVPARNPSRFSEWHSYILACSWAPAQLRGKKCGSFSVCSASKAFFGLLMIAFLFVALGLVIVHIGNALSTGDLIIGIIAGRFFL